MYNYIIGLVCLIHVSVGLWPVYSKIDMFLITVLWTESFSMLWLNFCFSVVITLKCWRNVCEMPLFPTMNWLPPKKSEFVNALFHLYIFSHGVHFYMSLILVFSTECMWFLHCAIWPPLDSDVLWLITWLIFVFFIFVSLVYTVLLHIMIGCGVGWSKRSFFSLKLSWLQARNILTP